MGGEGVFLFEIGQYERERGRERERERERPTRITPQKQICNSS